VGTVDETAPAAAGGVVGWWRARPARIQDRMVGLALAAPTGAVLAIARSLSPSPLGHSTHRQLGLGGCTILTAFGVPCPMCGMTTTFTHLAHLQPVHGTWNQPFGLVLFTLTALAFVLGALELVAPRGRWRTVLAWVDRREGRIAIGLLVGMIGGWAWKWAMMGGLIPLTP
jgi:hypothetical protein